MPHFEGATEMCVLSRVPGREDRTLVSPILGELSRARWPLSGGFCQVQIIQNKCDCLGRLANSIAHETAHNFASIAVNHEPDINGIFLRSTNDHISSHAIVRRPRLFAETFTCLGIEASF